VAMLGSICNKRAFSLRLPSVSHPSPIRLLSVSHPSPIRLPSVSPSSPCSRRERVCLSRIEATWPLRPPWRQPRGKTIVFTVNSHTNAASKGQHLWEIDLGFAPGLPPEWSDKGVSPPIRRAHALRQTRGTHCRSALIGKDIQFKTFWQRSLLHSMSFTSDIKGFVRLTSLPERFNWILALYQIRRAHASRQTRGTHCRSAPPLWSRVEGKSQSTFGECYLIQVAL